ncbi:hypothetical protein WISP_131475 [Willisornis vidua]|uniref:Carbonic anhydrase n=1 Tax=Willisornis vidua TaxID=1566151 RepID=A0ABQ9CPI8_9PASS|nr:hypothetical protein WISP_131475 [Willisornis vidua]
MELLFLALFSLHILKTEAVVKVTLDSSPKVGGGGLARRYKAVEFHLHWGVPSVQASPPGAQQYSPGSEHSIDGEKYAMELHLVHIREDVSDVTEAKKYKDGLAVLAFFIKVDEENKNYAPLLNELENIQYKGQTAQMEPLPLSSLLPPEEDLGRFYRYEGSLTTPDCHEGVIWTIFEKPVELSLPQEAERDKETKPLLTRNLFTLSTKNSAKLGGSIVQSAPPVTNMGSECTALGKINSPWLLGEEDKAFGFVLSFMAHPEGDSTGKTALASTASSPPVIQQICVKPPSIHL